MREKKGNEQSKKSNEMNFMLTRTLKHIRLKINSKYAMGNLK